MEVSPSSISNYGGEAKALKGLLEAFGSMFSLEEIASAYCNASQNAELAGQILCDMQASSSTFLHAMSNGGVKGDESLEPPCRDIPKKSCHENGKSRTGKQKWRPVSMGTVSSVLGKDYVKPSPVINISSTTTKPLKLDAAEVPISGISEDATKSKNDRIHDDMEDFLFKMLGDGFKLERDMIHQVLEACGYDMGQSMEKLIDMSAEILDRKNEYAFKPSEKLNCSNSGGSSYHKKWQPQTSLEGNTTKVANLDEEELRDQEQARQELGKEVLAALFSAAERSEDIPKRPAKATRRNSPYGTPVMEAPREPILQRQAKPVGLQQDDGNDEEEYELLRKAVRENRVTMREYYKSAVNSFAKGDYDRANKLMEKGHLFRERAVVADNESSQMIFQTKNVDTRDEIELDLHDHGPKDAIRTLKFHLSTLSGIPSFKHLKVVIDGEEEDSTKGARRRLVLKLMEKESIKWTEGGDGRSILIHLERINPKNLSFANKTKTHE